MNAKRWITPGDEQINRAGSRQKTRGSSRLWGKLASAALLLSLAAGAGCASSGSSGHGAGLMGLDSQPAQAVWADWTPVARGEAGLLPGAFVDQVVAFDYWQIDTGEYEEDAWSGTASILDYLRRESNNGGALSPGQRATATLLLQALDGAKEDAGARRMDVTFVVSLDPDAAQEGLIVRFYAPLTDKCATPGLAIYLGRVEGQTDGFERALLWASPGFEQAEAFTIALHRLPASAGAASDGARWSAVQYDGIVAPEAPSADAAAEGESLDGVADLAEAIFRRQLWAPLTGTHYIEATELADTERALPAGIKPALGLTLRERQIEEIYRDTVFIPRGDVPAQFL